MSGIAELATVMTSIARTAITAFTGPQRDAALFPFPDHARTRWSYLPGERPGVGLLGLDERARKAAHRLLATALSRHAFAQAVTIMALEEVLDLDEGRQRDRYSDDYRVAIFGTPGDDAWAWRFEGHHLSVTATVIGDQVVVAPLFLGANPARIKHRGRFVLGPLSREEDLARAALAEIPTDLLGEALVADTAPRDIRTRISPRVDGLLEPAGIVATRLPTPARALLGELVVIYLERLTPVLAEHELRQLDLDALSFAWEGGEQPREGHYYRLQSPGLLIEYDNTQRNANHAHTVLRRPGADFGEDLLAAHLATEHG